VCPLEECPFQFNPRGTTTCRKRTLKSTILLCYSLLPYLFFCGKKSRRNRNNKICFILFVAACRPLENSNGDYQLNFWSCLCYLILCVQVLSLTFFGGRCCLEMWAMISAFSSEIRNSNSNFPPFSLIRNRSSDPYFWLWCIVLCSIILPVFIAMAEKSQTFFSRRGRDVVMFHLYPSDANDLAHIFSASYSYRFYFSPFWAFFCLVDRQASRPCWSIQMRATERVFDVLNVFFSCQHTNTPRQHTTTTTTREKE
jgi:hypothetical protein